VRCFRILFWFASLTNPPPLWAPGCKRKIRVPEEASPKLEFPSKCLYEWVGTTQTTFVKWIVFINLRRLGKKTNNANVTPQCPEHSSAPVEGKIRFFSNLNENLNWPYPGRGKNVTSKTKKIRNNSVHKRDLYGDVDGQQFDGAGRIPRISPTWLADFYIFTLRVEVPSPPSPPPFLSPSVFSS